MSRSDDEDRAVKALRKRRERDVAAYQRRLDAGRIQEARERAAADEASTHILLDLGDLIEDVGYLVVNEHALTRGLATLYLRGTGAPRGRAQNSQEEQRRLEEVQQLKLLFAPIARDLIAGLDRKINDWLRGVVVIDPHFQKLSREDFLARLESCGTAFALTLLGAPSVHQHVLDIRRDRSLAGPRDRKRLRLAFKSLATDLERPGRKRAMPPANAAAIRKAFDVNKRAVQALRLRHDFRDADDTDATAAAIQLVRQRGIKTPWSLAGEVVRRLRDGGTKGTTHTVTELLTARQFEVTQGTVRRVLST